MVEQPGFHPFLSGRDNLRALCRVLARPDREAGVVLERTGLTARARDRYATYSLGMKQRLGVAAALLGDPQLLILDGPANGLHPFGISEMRNLMRELAGAGVTVFLSSHILAEVSVVCDRVAIVRAGQLFLVDPVSDLLARDAPFVIDTPSPEGARAALAEMGPTVQAHTVGQFLVIESRGWRGRDIVKALVQRGIEVDGLRRTEITLEEIFIRIASEDLASPVNRVLPGGGEERPGGVGPAAAEK